MLPLERQNRILEILAVRKAASVEELCRELYSSGATIRRDLAYLESSGLLCRTHGGAVRMEESGRDFPLLLRESENTVSKDIIARKALELIEDGQTIFMDASSTVCRLAEKLSGFQRLRVITNGLKTAGILAEKDGVEVYCTGGRLRGNAKSFVGLPAVSFVEKFHADTAFFSCRGVSEEAGVTDASEEEADLKRTYLRHARRSVLLADSSKLSLQYFCRICALDEIDTLVSDIPLSAPYDLSNAPETATK